MRILQLPSQMAQQIQATPVQSLHNAGHGVVLTLDEKARERFQSKRKVRVSASPQFLPAA